MLKMIKYELLGSYRQFFFAFLIYLGLCFLVPMLPESIFLDIGTVGVSVLLFGMLCMLFYNVIKYYQRTMFKRQGYLTLTLPVSSSVLVGAKLISTLIWFVLGTFVLVIGFMIFVMMLGQADLSVIFKVFREFFSQFGNYAMDIFKSIIVFLMSECLNVLYIFLIITFVHTHWFKKNRSLWGIACYFVGMYLYVFVASQFPVVSSDSPLFYLINFGLCAALFCSNIYLLQRHIEVE